eukprot:GSMAST32.ASY1.ANO1.821.1 assembled CDS
MGTTFSTKSTEAVSTKGDFNSNQKSEKIGSSIDEIHAQVRSAYHRTAEGGSLATGASAGCCGVERDYDAVSMRLGYTAEDIEKAGESNLGLGCGQPVSWANLKPGEFVIDLGSGAGFDCVLAAGQVGPKGKVVGIDMTPKMVDKANRSVKEKGLSEYVQFIHSEIEHLPVESGMFDCLLSNCVVNLSPDKNQVSFRVLKEGGRLCISDIIATTEIPERLQTAEALAC